MEVAVCPQHWETDKRGEGVRKEKRSGGGEGYKV